jgi:hypothetical protein
LRVRLGGGILHVEARVPGKLRVGGLLLGGDVGALGLGVGHHDLDLALEPREWVPPGPHDLASHDVGAHDHGAAHGVLHGELPLGDLAAGPELGDLLVLGSSLERDAGRLVLLGEPVGVLEPQLAVQVLHELGLRLVAVGNELLGEFEGGPGHLADAPGGPADASLDAATDLPEGPAEAESRLVVAVVSLHLLFVSHVSLSV